MAVPKRVFDLFEVDVGLRFCKVALQVNPYRYVVEREKTDKWGNADAYNEAMVKAAIDHGIALVAITDHHSPETDGLGEALTDAGIVVLPGAEITASNGVHFLAIFDEGTSHKAIETVVASCGRSSESSVDRGGVAAHETIEEIARAGGLAIAAHVLLKKSGLLGKAEGQERVRAWTHPYLTAACLDRDRAQDEGIAKIVDNRDGNHRRKRPLTLINSADVYAPGDFSKKSTWTWMAMTQPSFRGLRLALTDPKSRVVRPHEDILSGQGPSIVAVTWEGGRLDGVAVHLHSRLNVLIGGRGAGKSSVIESLRHALNAEVPERRRRAHEGIFEHVIGTASSTHVLIRDGERRFVISREGRHAPVVTEAGKETGLTPEALLPSMRIMGQHEIADTAEDIDRRNALLRPFYTAGESLRPFETHLRKLAENRSHIADVIKTIQRLESDKEELDELTAELKHLRKKGVEKQIERMTGEDRAITLIDRVAQWLEGLEQARIDQGDAAEGSSGLLREEQIADLPAADRLRELRGELQEARERLGKRLEELAAEQEGLHELVNSALEERRSSLAAAEKEVNKLLQSRATKAAAAAETYRRKVKRREQLSDVPKNLDRERRLFDELNNERAGLLDDLAEAQARHQAKLAEAAGVLQDRLREQARQLDTEVVSPVRVTYRTVTDVTALFSLIDETVSGHRSKIEKALEERREMELERGASEMIEPLTGRILAQTCTAGPEGVQNLLPSVTEAQANNLCKAFHESPEALLHLQEIGASDHTRLELDLNGEWRDIDNVSVGQQATAVLLVLLASGDGPLIIDQPEDDLDNAFIVNAIVPLLRAAKKRQQYVLSSHNANIPVLGDAEVVTVMASEPAEALGDDPGIGVAITGGLDDPNVQMQVETLLEGGRGAFEERRRRYGIDDAAI